jgi:ABC-type multidrug transport system fused ATPase/permease subunit
MLLKFCNFSKLLFYKYINTYILAICAAILCSFAEAYIPFYISKLIENIVNGDLYMKYAFYGLLWNTIYSISAIFRGGIFTCCNHYVYFEYYNLFIKRLLKQSMEIWDTHELFTFEKINHLLVEELHTVVYDSSLIWNMVIRTIASFLTLIFLLGPLNIQLLFYCFGFSLFHCICNVYANNYYSNSFDKLVTLRNSIISNAIEYIKTPLLFKYYNLEQTLTNSYMEHIDTINIYIYTQRSMVICFTCSSKSFISQKF